MRRRRYWIIEPSVDSRGNTRQASRSPTRAVGVGPHGAAQEADVQTDDVCAAWQCPVLYRGHGARVGAHWVARRVQALRHQRQIDFSAVRPVFVQRNNNDFADALTICEAAPRPTIENGLRSSRCGALYRGGETGAVIRLARWSQRQTDRRHGTGRGNPDQVAHLPTATCIAETRDKRRRRRAHTSQRQTTCSTSRTATFTCGRTSGRTSQHWTVANGHQQRGNAAVPMDLQPSRTFFARPSETAAHKRRWKPVWTATPKWCFFGDIWLHTIVRTQRASIGRVTTDHAIGIDSAHGTMTIAGSIRMPGMAWRIAGAVRPERKPSHEFISQPRYLGTGELRW